VSIGNCEWMDELRVSDNLHPTYSVLYYPGPGLDFLVSILHIYAWIIVHVIRWVKVKGEKSKVKLDYALLVIKTYDGLWKWDGMGWDGMGSRFLRFRFLSPVRVSIYHILTALRSTKAQDCSKLILGIK
jgi:hypothetical protein